MDGLTDGRTHGFGSVIDVYLHTCIMKNVAIFGVKGKNIYGSAHEIFVLMFYMSADLRKWHWMHFSNYYIRDI